MYLPSLPEGRALQTGSPQQPCALPVSQLAQGTRWHCSDTVPALPPLHRLGLALPCPGCSAGLSSPSQAGLWQGALARSG